MYRMLCAAAGLTTLIASVLPEAAEPVVTERRSKTAACSACSMPLRRTRGPFC